MHSREECSRTCVRGWHRWSRGHLIVSCRSEGGGGRGSWPGSGGLWLGVGKEMNETLHVLPHLGNHGPQTAVLLLETMDLF
ncbi:hypothetical protein CgunFtcFv8_027711 [Champsocephalus gunnari]|uniref:Uncharacterized protein n=1 Tax=Champsocephalus gunnari TaxID=52237 RepID=A0AAN8I2H1_CHAGU|nr:hypothetical protein CgunFtcFv8_027711 [Champsocephalus gunnari]